MSKSCKSCMKEVDAFYLIQYLDLAGWCSKECYDKWLTSSEQEEVRKKEEWRRNNVGIRVM